jgi:hypothetical protein
MQHTFRSLLAVLPISIYSASAHAYIDPGTGLLAIQGLLAVLVSVLFVIRHPIAAFKQLLEKLKRREDEDEGPAE